MIKGFLSNLKLYIVSCIFTFILLFFIVEYNFTEFIILAVTISLFININFQVINFLLNKYSSIRTLNLHLYNFHSYRSVLFAISVQLLLIIVIYKICYYLMVGNISTYEIYKGEIDGWYNFTGVFSIVVGMLLYLYPLLLMQPFLWIIGLIKPHILKFLNRKGVIKFFLLYNLIIGISGIFLWIVFVLLDLIEI